MSDPNQPYQPYQQPPPPPQQTTVPAAPMSPYPYPGQPQRPKRPFWYSTGGTWAIIGIVFGGIAVIVVAVVIVGAVVDRQAAKDMDVKITGCRMESDFLPSATVDLTVTNHGDRARGASVRIEYRDTRGDLIDTDTARVASIQPGDTAHKQEVTFLDADPGPTGTCKIVGVS